MSKVQMLRCLVNQRLTAAAQEIFGLIERTIAEYEEELCSSREENERHRKRLDAVFNPEVRNQRADVQQLLVVQEEVPPEQQVWSSSLDQEDPEPPHIKEEQEDFWTSQEGEQLQGLDEAGINFSFTVKSEDEEEEAQSSQLHQRQTEHMETEADGEDCGGPEPDRKSDPERPPGPDTDNETGDSSGPETDDCKRNKEPLWGSNSLADQNLCICSECGKRFSNRTNLKVHMLVHTVLNPFFCTLCNIRFPQKRKLIRHMKRHQPAKGHRCPEDQEDPEPPHMKEDQEDPEPPHMKEDQEDPEPPHMKEDQEEADGEDCGEPDTEPETDDWKRNKEPSCGSNSHQKVLDQRFFGDRKLSICSECGKRFGNRANLKVHMLVHTEPKPFCCTLCNGRFPQKKKLIGHMNLHHRQKDGAVQFVTNGFDTAAASRDAWRVTAESRPGLGLIVFNM